MKLSEAIRLGSMVKPQGSCRTSDNPMSGEAVCALGAASEALGHPKEEELRYTLLEAQYPFLHGRHEAVGPCGCEFIRTKDIMCVIWHLNDTHKWTRERIADWVATIEPKEQHDLQPESNETISYLPNSSPALAGGLDE